MDRRVLITIIVAALGYFVDIFDLLLFSIVRLESLEALGVRPHEILSSSVYLITMQTAGLLAGGIVWGIMGDKKGRLSVLFGSILLYSLANILNGFVHTVDQYAVLRFIAGFGLAGELGAGITLASEILPSRYRGYGTSFIAGIGLLGATAAAVISTYVDWRTAYVIGGVMGLVILVLRMNVTESGLFEKMETDRSTQSLRGNLILFWQKPYLIRRFLMVTLVGAPIWYVVSIIFTFAPEFANDIGYDFIPTTAQVIFYGYLGMALGDFASGFLSQILKSRKISIYVFMLMMISFTALWLLSHDWQEGQYMVMMLLIGFGCGYWAMFVQISAEHFGTNLRATVTTSAPNLVRGFTIPMTVGFHSLAPTLGVSTAGLVIGIVTVAIALVALYCLEETFDRNLDYVD